MLRFKALNIVTCPWDPLSLGFKELDLSVWISLLLPLPPVSFTQFSPLASSFPLICPSSIHPAIHLLIFLSIKFTNCLYLFLYVWFSVDFCVGSCLDTCLPFLDQFPLSSLSIWKLRATFLCRLFCLNGNACTFETNIFFLLLLLWKKRSPQCSSHSPQQSKQSPVLKVYSEGSGQQRSHSASIKRAVFN